MQKRPSRTSEIRLAELVAALSIATDLGMGQPMEYVLRSTTNGLTARAITAARLRTCSRPQRGF